MSLITQCDHCGRWVRSSMLGAHTRKYHKGKEIQIRNRRPGKYTRLFTKAEARRRYWRYTPHHAK